ncbi:MAG TPA: hypothetical protein VGT44_22980, partial [Ktedonobacteraceae bacterium]|nr:hypothetical protein [Ktedonobacteraceae bacterium]
MTTITAIKRNIIDGHKLPACCVIHCREHVELYAIQPIERMAISMVQLPRIKLSQRSLKRLLFGGLSGSVGLAGVFLAVSYY